MCACSCVRRAGKAQTLQHCSSTPLVWHLFRLNQGVGFTSNLVVCAQACSKSSPSDSGGVGRRCSRRSGSVCVHACARGSVSVEGELFFGCVAVVFVALLAQRGRAQGQHKRIDTAPAPDTTGFTCPRCTPTRMPSWPMKACRSCAGGSGGLLASRRRCRAWSSASPNLAWETGQSESRHPHAKSTAVSSLFVCSLAPCYTRLCRVQGLPLRLWYGISAGWPR